MPSPGVYTFEAIDADLPFIPLAGRRVLDVLGRKLSLEALALAVAPGPAARVRGGGEGARGRLRGARRGRPRCPHLSRCHPRRSPIPEPVRLRSSPRSARCGPSTARAGAPCAPLDRYALAQVRRQAREARAGLRRDRRRDADVPSLTHLDAAREARMVDVGDKPETSRRAVASARVRTTRETVRGHRRGSACEGDVLAAARVAGIQAAKRTPELMPLCHPVRTTRAAVDFELDAERARCACAPPSRRSTARASRWRP